MSERPDRPERAGLENLFQDFDALAGDGPEIGAVVCHGDGGWRSDLVKASSTWLDDPGGVAWPVPRGTIKDWYYSPERFLGHKARGGPREWLVLQVAGGPPDTDVRRQAEENGRKRLDRLTALVCDLVPGFADALPGEGRTWGWLAYLASLTPPPDPTARRQTCVWDGCLVNGTKFGVWVDAAEGDTAARTVTKGRHDDIIRKYRVRPVEVLPDWWVVCLPNVFAASAVAVERVMATGVSPTPTGSGVDHQIAAVAVASPPIRPRHPKQLIILEALRGKILRQKVLASLFDVDGNGTPIPMDLTQLKRDYLKPLMDEGLVCHDKKAGGYFRPDAPPAEWEALPGAN